ncbi:MAG: type I-E CRISPR-associated protein Cas7/Cse4/CasC [Chlorobi bacterium]|nr:type I-E CRISPR-associated protein Cas7/Cse4/CasC [Chlorobiota bacterium]
MLIELHSLTSHSPANLNRDDLGRPKSAVFGGVNRARISSQAIKRSIRTSNYVEETLHHGISTRSRQIPKMIYEELLPEFQGDPARAARLKDVCRALPGAFGKVDAQHEMQTSQIVFLTPDEISRTASYVREIVRGDEKLTQAAVKELIAGAAAAIGLNRNPGDGVDMALFGRMTTDDANSFASVDAAMQVAHAISTHAVTPETDWFTAVDDVLTDNDERGSGHIGEIEFNSATFYKYFSCNLPLLVKNMNGASEDAIDALATVLDAACRVTPSGKQNSYASHSLADTVLLVIRQQRIPVSLANAFERPVPKDETLGYLAPSRARMLRHYRDLAESYSLNDRAICFCSDSEARSQLQALLPSGTQMVGSLKELFDIMWTMIARTTPATPAARRATPARAEAITAAITAPAEQQTSVPSPSLPSTSLPTSSPTPPQTSRPAVSRFFPASETGGAGMEEGSGELFGSDQTIRTSDPNAPKRGRGRPPKDPNAPPKPKPEPADPNAPKRGRGRPPKNPNAPPKPKPEPADPNAPKRGRGRPPKDPNAPPKPKPQPADPNAPKRGRGRPRKDAQTASQTAPHAMPAPQDDAAAMDAAMEIAAIEMDAAIEASAIETSAPGLPTTEPDAAAEPQQQSTTETDHDVMDGGSI